MIIGLFYMSSLNLSVYLPTSTSQWCEQKQKHKQLQWSLDLASDIWLFKRSLQFPQYANKYNPSTGTIAHYFQFRVLIYSFSVSMSAKLKQATHQRYIHETGLKRPEMLHIIWSSMYPWFQPHTWRSYNQKVSVCNARVTRTWSRDWFLWPRAGRESIYDLHEKESAAIWKALWKLNISFLESLPSYCILSTLLRFELPNYQVSVFPSFFFFIRAHQRKSNYQKASLPIGTQMRALLLA